MAYTGDEVFAQAISILDEISDAGTIVDAQIKEYKYRAPYLLDLWQHEMATKGKLYATQVYTNASQDNVNKWVKFTLPTGMKKIKDVMFLDSDSQIGQIQYRKFGNTDIYFCFPELGTVQMLYVPTPAKITTLTQTLEIDESLCMSGAYYLAEQFAMADQNDELASMCRNKYKELKLESGDDYPLAPTEIVDVYGISNMC